MKKIFNLIAAAAIIAGFASCQPKSEDAFPTDPVAPELYAHSDILLTTGTPDEDVTFAWSAYRNLPKGLPYTFTASYGEDEVVLVNTEDLFFSVSKAEFKEILTGNFEFPENSTASFTFKVKVADGAAVYESAPLSVNVYVNGDAVAPEFTLVMEPAVLDPTKAADEIVLAEWSEARLVYGETVTYGVGIKVGEEGAVYSLTGDKPISGTSYKLTVDELNEALVAAGAPEAEECQMSVVVTAYCESLPNGIDVTSEPVAVTTFVSTFPDILYIPGSHQGWDPATAPTIKQSTAQKGYYEGIVDLTTEGAENTEFKFCPVPAWENDFGGKVEVEAIGEGGFAVAIGTVGVSDNIVVPSGVYNISLNKKLNTITLCQFETLSLIGSAVGDYSWGQDVDLEYDAEAGTFSAITTFKPGEFKIRFNHDWTISMGGELNAVSFSTGGNIASEVDGEYKLVLDVNTVPYTIKFINTAFPEQVYLPGAHNGWDHSKTVLPGDGEGHYEGFVAVGGDWGFKITPAPNWDSEWGWDGQTVTDNVWGLTSTGAGNIFSSDGASTELTYCKVKIDLTALTCTLTPITSVGIIGSFPDNNWSSDAYPLAYDAASDVWKAEGVAIQKNCEWKFRMNGDWAVNLGGDLANLEADGANIKVDPGVYTVELSISKQPYTATLTKTGDVDAPTLPETMYIIGTAVGGWDWAANAVDMIQVNGKAGGFWAIRYIRAGEGFKFCAVKEWNGDFTGLGNDSGYTVSDGNCFVAADGLYIIGIDAAGDKVVVEPAHVYGIGDCFGGWDNGVELTVNANGTVSSGALAAGELRLYTSCSIFDVSWWQMEFVPIGGVIEYRGNGGDQTRVPVSAGQSVTLDFNAGTGVIQ